MAGTEELKGIVRLVDVDVIGTKTALMAIKEIKGVNFSLANAICQELGLEKSKKIGAFSDNEIEKVKDAVKNPEKYGIPTRMLNRQKDYDTGEDKHLTSADLKLTKDFDIKRLKKIKSYRGMRHAFGLPVRGQRTKANFRKGKTVGVRKKSSPGKK
jgi:small subunit ribosomal protein S13